MLVNHTIKSVVGAARLSGVAYLRYRLRTQSS